MKPEEAIETAKKQIEIQKNAPDYELMYSWKDTLTNRFGAIMLYKSEKQLMRDIQVAKKNGAYKNCKNDLQLWFLGSFDTTTGDIKYFPKNRGFVVADTEE